MLTLGVSVMLAFELFVGLATLGTETFTGRGLLSEAEAVYEPGTEMRPRAKFGDEVTVEFEEPAGVTVHVCVWAAARETKNEIGATPIGTASLKSRDTMELFADSLMAAVRTVTEPVRTMGLGFS